jgi:hypothetical protein
MQYELEEIFPLPTIQRLCESFLHLDNLPTALLDHAGKVHVAVGWQDICVKFHRIKPPNVRTLPRKRYRIGKQASGGWEI